jgi:hypothetical protein
MKHFYAGRVIFTMCLQLVTVSAFAQIISDPAIIRQQLAGKHLEVTRSNGIYEFSYSISVHYCASGKYISDVQRSRTTVMGNHEEHNFRDFGKWDLVSVEGKTYLIYVSFTSGERNAIPVALLPNGKLWAQGFDVTVMGRAQCE